MADEIFSLAVEHERRKGQQKQGRGRKRIIGIVGVPEIPAVGPYWTDVSRLPTYHTGLHLTQILHL
jgi:hypothetical protein